MAWMYDTYVYTYVCWCVCVCVYVCVCRWQHSEASNRLSLLPNHLHVCHRKNRKRASRHVIFSARATDRGLSLPACGVHTEDTWGPQENSAPIMFTMPTSAPCHRRSSPLTLSEQPKKAHACLP